MEDAMVINRGSLQRGLAYGTVYKSEFIDLKELASRSPAVMNPIFLFIPTGKIISFCAIGSYFPKRSCKTTGTREFQ